MKHPDSGGRLFRKYVVVLLVLVGGVLMASSLVELYFSYRETQFAILRVERAKAVAAAAGIEKFLKEIEQHVRETTRTASDDPDASHVGQGRLGFRQGLGVALSEQRELDFLRLLRNVPAVSQLSHLDLAGKEQLRISRLDPDVIGSQEDFSQTPNFLQARAGKTYWSPVYFKNESEPYVTLAVPVGKHAVEVTTAEISLRAVLKIISQIDVGPGGYAYVVDSRNHLVAHPDSRLLREKRDVSALIQVKSARADPLGSKTAAPIAVVADGLGGGQVLAAHSMIASPEWLVFVERPAADAYAPLRAPIIRSAIIFVLGLGLSVLASLLLARRMVAPIRVLQEGAARIGAGELDHGIEVSTGDELEALADQFNNMTERLRESYSSLERKVDERTTEVQRQASELAEWNRTLELRVAEGVRQIEHMGQLKRFLSPQIADLIVNGATDDPLKSHRREITVVFLDLRGFTAFTETADPEEVMELLHEYHNQMGRLIMAYNGTIEHFAGDGIMIVFNDPVVIDNPAWQAVSMAIQMQADFAGLSKTWKRHGHELHMGIGIAQGHATLGVIGFEDRRDYTAIGVVCNLASRLCGEAKAGQILVSQKVFGFVEDFVIAAPVGDLNLKGFHKTIPAFNVTGLK